MFVIPAYEWIILMVQKKIWFGKYLFYHSKSNLPASNAMLTVRLKTTQYLTSVIHHTLLKAIYLEGTTANVVNEIDR